MGESNVSSVSVSSSPQCSSDREQTSSNNNGKEEEDMTIEELKEILWPREVQAELIYEVKIAADTNKSSHRHVDGIMDGYNVFPIVMRQDLIGRKFKEMIGNIVWDGAVVMHEYFQDTNHFPPGYFRGKKVLELGAGLGLVGITLAYLGAEVYMTDLPDALEILQYNVDENIKKLSITLMEDGSEAGIDAKTKKQKTMLEHLNLILPKVEALSWGTKLSEEQKIRQPYDMIVGADITYIKEFYDALIQTFKDTSTEKRSSEALPLSSNENVSNENKNHTSQQKDETSILTQEKHTDIYIGHLDRGEEFTFFNYMRGHGFVLEEVFMKHLKLDEGLAANHSPNLHVYKGFKL